MIVKYDDLWNSKDDIILVTTNSYVKKDGKLVMGRGAAKEMATRYPPIPIFLGEQINLYFKDTKKYGVLICHPYTYSQNGEKIYHRGLGAFQVKYNWWERADMDLIKFSSDVLVDMLDKVEQFKDMSVSMNFPGIGNGKLDFEDVFKIVNKLPDSISLYIK